MKLSAKVSARALRVLIGVVISMLLLTLTALAQDPSSQPEQSPAAQSQSGQQAVPAGPEAEESAAVLHVMVGRSLVISSPAQLKRVSIADPNVADAVIVSPTQVMVNGKSPGAVSLVMWDAAGHDQSFEIFVELDVLTLQRTIQENFPNEPIQVGASKDVITLSGRVSSAAVADKALELVKASAPKVVSLMEVPPPPPIAEILVQVKFAEVDRTVVSQLGLNIMSLPGAKNIGSITTQQFGPPTISDDLSAKVGGFKLSDLLNIFIFRPDIDLAATIKALEQKNLLQILAEPNVLTASGKEGSFLAGGEFPVPIVQPGGAGGVPVITIQWKQFGVQLNFAPTMTSDGTIHLKVRPEVSTLDFTNSVTVSGFLIPAVSTRRVESEMELRDGQSFAIAGLVDNRVQETFSKIPGIGNIPVLGKLFQSRNLNKSNSELLVVVTPRIVKPLSPSQVPAGPVYPVPFLPPAKAPAAKPGV